MNFYLQRLIRFSTIVIVQLAWCCGLNSQYLPLYSLASLDPYIFHSSYAGVKRELIITGIYRDQWTGINGSPSTQRISGHLPFPWFGLNGGFTVENDRIGLEQHTRASLSINKIWDFTDWVISAGLSPVYHQLNINGSLIRSPDGTYSQGTINHNDPSLPLTLSKLSTLDVAASLYVRSYWADIGISLDNMLRRRAKEQFMSWAESNMLKVSLTRSFAIQKLRISPWIYIYSDFVQLQTEIICDFEFNGSIFAGVAMRGFTRNTYEAISIKAGYPLIKNVMLAYAFDIPLQGKSFKNRIGSHEILIQYRIFRPQGWGKRPKIQYNPRYFD